MKHQKVHGAFFIGVLILFLLTSACNARTDDSSEEREDQPFSSSVSVAETMPEEDVQSPASESDAQPINYSVVKEYFFGTWVPDNGSQIFFGYGDESHANVYSPLISAYMDKSDNAVMTIIRGGEAYQYSVSLSELNTMTVNSNEIPDDVKYTKSADAGEPTDVFGYMDILEYCIGETSANVELADSPFSLFYDTVVTLNDGSKWERSATLETRYPTLYVIEKSANAITLRSLFYPEGSDPDSAADVAKEIIFIISYEGSAWEISSASLA